MLIDHLGIETLFSVAGGSMGGMQVLQWAATYPERVFSRAADRLRGARHSSQNIAFHEVGRQAVMADPEWRGGRYLERRHQPAKRPRGGAHGGPHHLPVRGCAPPQVRAQPPGPRARPTFALRRRFPDRSYLRHQGSTFVDRFDANSYLYLTRAMDYFDLAADYDGGLANAFKGTRTRFCVVSFTSRLAVPDRREQGGGARAQRRGAPASASSRSRPTAATMPSCSTSRNCSPPSAASSPRASHARASG